MRQLILTACSEICKYNVLEIQRNATSMNMISGDQLWARKMY